jgi:hypothetical protein
VTAQRLTRAELDALAAEVRAGAGDWAVTSLKVDGVPVSLYVPADEVPAPENEPGAEGQEASS